MTFAKNRLLTIIILVALILALPVAIFLTRKQQDIRPRALLGATNFLLNSDKTEVKEGEKFNVGVSIQLSNPTVKASAVDFTLLYNKSKLKVNNVIPVVGNQTGKFTEAPISISNQVYPEEGDGNFNFLRVALISNKPNNELPSGTVSIANIEFEALDTTDTNLGDTTIKFPDDDNVLQVVGWGGN